jgi:hypothetical protein
MKTVAKYLLTLVMLAVTGVANAQYWQDVPVEAWVHEWRNMVTPTDGAALVDEDGAFKVHVRSAEQALKAGNMALADMYSDPSIDNLAVWDSQFLITFGEDNILKEGDKIRVTMDIKADKYATVSTLSESAPYSYLYWKCLGDVQFTDEYVSYDSGEKTVEANMSGMYTICFNLATGHENNFYFKNIRVQVLRGKVIENWVNIITNSDLSGSDLSSYRCKEYPSAEIVAPTVQDGVIVVNSPAKVNYEYESMFWIVLPQYLPDETLMKVRFRYKASSNANVLTLCNDSPGEYLHFSCIGDVPFSTEWNTYETTVLVPKECNGRFRSIAFNLSKDEAITYYFDDIVVEVDEDIIVPPTPKIWEDVDIKCLVHEWRSIYEVTDGPALTDLSGAYKVHVRSAEQALKAGNMTVAYGDMAPGLDNFARWDTQFFITFGKEYALEEGDKIRVTMDIKADIPATVETQAHAAPTSYLYWQCLGDVNVTDEYKRFDSGERTVNSYMDGMYTVTFLLSDGNENNFYFKNIKVQVLRANATKWTNIIVNSDLSSEDLSCFRSMEYPSEEIVTPTVEKGAIVVNSPAMVDAPWNSQFWILLPQTIPDGKKMKVSFKCKASIETSVSTQYHGAPAEYLHYECLGDVPFTTEWTTFETTVTVPSACNANFHSIAFLLAKEGEDITYYFDNIVVAVDESIAVNPQPYPKDDDEPVIDIPEFPEGYENLATIPFIDATGVPHEVENNISTADNIKILSGGDVVIGPSDVSADIYADYTGYDEILIVCGRVDDPAPARAISLLSPEGVSFSVLLNGYLQENNSVTCVERTAFADANGYARVDVSDLDFVHLNAIKIQWGVSNAVAYAVLGKKSGQGDVKTVTVEEFNNAEVSNDVWYQLTGKVRNLKDGDLYGNFDLEDETGSVYVYGLLSEKGGEKKHFQELVAEKGIQNGSKLTIIGTRGDYRGKIEVLNAYFVSVDNSGIIVPTFIIPPFPEGYENLANIPFMKDGETVEVEQNLSTVECPVILTDDDIVIGTRNTAAEIYADYSDYEEILLVCGKIDEENPAAVFTTPSAEGICYRAMLNREPQEDGQGPLIEKQAVSDADGYVHIDISDLEYAHLNAIKVSYRQPSNMVFAVLGKKKPTQYNGDVVTFDFNSSAYPVSDSYGSTAGDITEDMVITEGGVTMTISPADEGNDTPNRFWDTATGPQLRMYSGTMTLTAPEGNPIVKVVVDYGRWHSRNTFNYEGGTNGEWTGSSPEVVLAVAGNTQMNKVVVTLAYKSGIAGDVNGDGVVDVADIAAIIDVMAGATDPDNPSTIAADVNGDKVVDVADIGTVIDIMATRARKK